MRMKTKEREKRLLLGCFLFFGALLYLYFNTLGFQRVKNYSHFRWVQTLDGESHKAAGISKIIGYFNSLINRLL